MKFYIIALLLVNIYLNIKNVTACNGINCQHKKMIGKKLNVPIHVTFREIVSNLINEDNKDRKIDAAYRLAVSKLIRFDMNNDGFLNKDEIYRLLNEQISRSSGKAKRVSRDQAKKYLSTFDTDGDGLLAIDEYLRVLDENFNTKASTLRTKINSLFKAINVAKSNHIRPSDLLDYLKTDLKQSQFSLALGEIENMIKEIDANGNNQIEPEEFIKLWECSGYMGEIPSVNCLFKSSNFQSKSISSLPENE
jgi:Ca2+-binding EF-hand superfamily protein